MKYRYLGNSGLKVSEICLGVMTFGGDDVHTEVANVGQKQANELVSAALDHGVNFFDSADVYTTGNSEILLGKALGNRRNEAVVATKVRFRLGSGPNDVGLSRHHIIKSCEASLKRLGTDYIDHYQIHSFDPRTPPDETLRALDQLVKSGKVRYIGCSNLMAWQMMKMLGVSEKLNLEKFVTTQLYYSIGTRDIEHELVPLCLDQNMGILCWSPLSGGFFSGKYRIGQLVPKDSRRSNPNAESLRWWPVDESKGYAIVEELDRISKNYNASIAQTALSFILKKQAVSAVIVGAKTMAQLLDNVKASDIELSDADFNFLDEVSRPVVPYPLWHQNYGNDR
jgi:Predicted oxidoreductases (related to aryl-alcohol dehydrogenases)